MYTSNLPRQKIESIDKNAESFGYSRRCSLTVVSSTQEQINDLVNSSLPAVVETLRNILDYQTHLQGMTSLNTASISRLVLSMDEKLDTMSEDDLLAVQADIEEYIQLTNQIGTMQKQ